MTPPSASRGRPGWPAPWANLIAAVVLVVAAVLTVDLLTGTSPIVAHRPGGNNVGPDITPTPSNVVIVPADPRSKVQGSIVYAKDGNL